MLAIHCLHVLKCLCVLLTSYCVCISVYHSVPVAVCVSTVMYLFVFTCRPMLWFVWVHLHAYVQEVLESIFYQQTSVSEFLKMCVRSISSWVPGCMSPGGLCNSLLQMSWQREKWRDGGWKQKEQWVIDWFCLSSSGVTSGEVVEYKWC